MSNSTLLLLVALGGAVGAMSRFSLSIWLGTGQLFPWTTLGINIAGSFFIGLLWAAFADTEWFMQWGRALLVFGLLGSFTTFSAFSLETLTMINNHRILQAGLYAMGSVVLCIVAVGLGYRIAT